MRGSARRLARVACLHWRDALYVHPQKTSGTSGRRRPDSQQPSRGRPSPSATRRTHRAPGAVELPGPWFCSGYRRYGTRTCPTRRKAGTDFCDLAMKTAPGLQWRPTYTTGTPAVHNPDQMAALQSVAPLAKSRAPRRTLSSAERLRLLARMFTRPVFADIARSGNWQVALGFLAEHGLLTAAKGQPLASLFESAWLEIRRAYRNEFVYKTEIASRIVFGRHSPNTASLHVELPVGRSIVDVAVFNGTSTAYEIKTEFDTPRRLPY
ncbi:hypothetical protein D9M69_249700 [compost metagenome]